MNAPAFKRPSTGIQRIDDWAVVMSTEQGRRCLEHLLYDICREDVAGYDPDPMELARRTGRREVADRVLGELRAADPLGNRFEIALLQAHIQQLREAAAASAQKEPDHAR